MRVAVVLPQREKFGPKVAGAIALTIRDFAYGSYTQTQLTVLGHAQTDTFENIAFTSVATKKFLCFSSSKAYTKQCIQTLKKTDVDIIEVHNRVAAAIAIKKAFPKRRIVLYLHNDPLTIRGLKTEQDRKAVCESIDAIICVSEFVKSRFNTEAQNIDNVFTVFNALPDLPLTIPMAQKKPVIVFAGRVVPDKGPLLLAKALLKVLPQHPEWRCVFVGAEFYGSSTPTSDYEKEVIATLSQLGNTVEYMHSQPNQVVMNLLTEASIMVMPSVWEEPFGRSLLEAMASACACISTRRGGLPEVAGDHALLLDTITEDTIADGLDLLIRDTAYRQHMQESGKAYVDQRFSIESQSSTLLNIRLKLMDKAK